MYEERPLHRVCKCSGKGPKPQISLERGSKKVSGFGRGGPGLSKDLVKCLAEAGAKASSASDLQEKRAPLRCSCRAQIPPWLLGMAISTGEDLETLEAPSILQVDVCPKMNSVSERPGGSRTQLSWRLVRLGVR